jgi:hypothetical protein
MNMKKRLWLTYVRLGERLQNLRRSFSPTRLRFVHYSWPLRAEVCPCDPDFCDYLRERQIRRQSVFHFGSGGHHLVGERNLADALENEILAITLAPAELRGYVNRVVRDPALAKHYKVLFADIYSLSAATLPVFDAATLFHLGEFEDAGSGSRRLDDAGVLQMFIAHLAHDGLLFLYPGSFAYAKVAPLIEQAVAQRQIEFVEHFRSLAVYRRAPH